MNPLRVGIIGCGNMGRRHARAWRYFEPKSRLMACYDVIPEAAEALGRQFGCQPEPSLEGLLARKDIDVVSICTIETAHVEPTARAAAASKHILLEKPMAICMEDGHAIQDAIKKTGVKCMVAHLFRFDQRCAQIKQAIEAGQIGDVVSVDCRFQGIPTQQDRIKNIETSIFVFRGCHGIDLMRWFTGSEPVRVYAERIEGKLRSLGYSSEDAMFCLMRFGNDAVGSIEVNSHVPQGHPTTGCGEITIIGRKGMIRTDLREPWFTLADEQGIRFSQGNQKDLWFREEIGAFMHHVIEDGPNIATVDDALAALKISLAAVKSSETQQPIILERDVDR